MDMIADLCELPARLKKRGNVSVWQLVQDSGYKTNPELLTVRAVKDYLASHKDLIEDWLMYSRDKRTTEGWYIKGLGFGLFTVGYYPGGPTKVCLNRRSACAEFIVQEIRSVGSS